MRPNTETWYASPRTKRPRGAPDQRLFKRLRTLTLKKRVMNHFKQRFRSGREAGCIAYTPLTSSKNTLFAAADYTTTKKKGLRTLTTLHTIRNALHTALPLKCGQAFVHAVALVAVTVRHLTPVAGEEEPRTGPRNLPDGTLSLLCTRCERCA